VDQSFVPRIGLAKYLLDPTGCRWPLRRVQRWNHPLTDDPDEIAQTSPNVPCDACFRLCHLSGRFEHRAGRVRLWVKKAAFILLILRAFRIGVDGSNRRNGDPFREL